MPETQGDAPTHALSGTRKTPRRTLKAAQGSGCALGKGQQRQKKHNRPKIQAKENNKIRHAPIQGNKATVKAITRGRKLSCAEITKLNLPETRKVVLKELSDKIQKTSEMLAQGKFRSVYEPKPIAVYLKNVKRGPLRLIH